MIYYPLPQTFQKKMLGLAKRALVVGVPLDKDPRKTGVINHIFGHTAMLKDEEFAIKCSMADASWIFNPAEIRTRLELLMEGNALSTI